MLAAPVAVAYAPDRDERYGETSIPCDDGDLLRAMCDWREVDLKTRASPALRRRSKPIAQVLNQIDDAAT